MAKNKGDKAVSAAERAAIQTMAEKGTPITTIAKAIDRNPKTVATVLNQVQEAKDLLVSNAKWYAEQHLAATAVAARDGNSKPAEFMLERLKVVEPAKEQSNQGFTVMIGVSLPGIGDRSTDAVAVGHIGQVLEGETVTGT